MFCLIRGQHVKEVKCAQAQVSRSAGGKSSGSSETFISSRDAW